VQQIDDLLLADCCHGAQFWRRHLFERQRQTVCTPHGLPVKLAQPGGIRRQSTGLHVSARANVMDDSLVWLSINAPRIPFPNHSCPGVEPQALQMHDKVRQQRHGWFRNGL